MAHGVSVAMVLCGVVLAIGICYWYMLCCCLQCSQAPIYCCCSWTLLLCLLLGIDVLHLGRVWLIPMLPSGGSSC